MRTFLVLSFLAFQSTAQAIDRPRPEAPRFRAKTIDGVSHDNDTIKGKVALIQFWTTWCRYCRADQSHIEQLTRDYPDSKLIVLAVSVGESRKKVEEYLKESPRQSKVIVNEDTNLPAVFGAAGFPYYVVLDSNGRIAGTQEGAGGAAIRDLLRKAGLE